MANYPSQTYFPCSLVSSGVATTVDCAVFTLQNKVKFKHQPHTHRESLIDITKRKNKHKKHLQEA